MLTDIALPRLGPLGFHRVMALLICVILLALVWHKPMLGGMLTRLQGLVYDGLLPQPATLLDPRVVIVDIDEDSLEIVGRWPWPRELTAELIAQTRAAGAAVVGVDILFPEPSSPQADDLLNEQLSARNVVSAIAFALGVHADGAVEVDGIRWPRATQTVAPASVFTPAAVGHITPLYEPDQIIRRMYPMACDGQCYPTLSLAMLQSWAGLDVTAHGRGGGLFRTLCVGDFCLWLNPDATVSIPYHHSAGFARISAARLLTDEAEPLPELDGALVLIGASAVGLGDRVATPVSATTPGVVLHGLLLASALDNLRWTSLPHGRWISSALIVVTLALAAAWPGTRRRYHLVVVGWMAGLALLTIALPHWGFWHDPVFIWAGLLSSTLLLIVWQGGQLLRQRRSIYRAFAAYVPHEVIKTLVRNNLRPEQLNAQRIQATVMFADIRGFTSLSERLEPEQLVDLTNQLFTAITEEIHRHRGTLDKFMGDAVMAFWGAPLPQPDHALLALRCAEAIQQRLRGMMGWLEENGYPDIAMTIGLESGPVAVGNFGSRQRRAYTVMGKTVNLAAHLQPMCAAHGVDILCGPGMCEHLPDRVRPLGKVTIRGIDGEQRIGTVL